MSRVVVLGHTYYPRDFRVRKEATVLAEAGHEVTVVCLRRDEEPREEKVGAVQVKRLGLARDRSRGKLGYLLEYARFFLTASAYVYFAGNKQRIDLVHVHNVPEELVFAALPARLRGAAVVLDIHDPMPELFRDKYGIGPGSAAMRLLERLEMASCRFADHVIVAADTFKRRLIEKGIPDEHITVVLNVPEPDLKRADRFVAVYHGSVFERYGLDTALRAVALAARSVPDIELHLFASDVDPAFLSSLKQLAEQLGIRDRVAFNGYVERLTMARTSCDADVGICPLRRSPHIDLAYPTKLFDYVALGLPVVAARTPAVDGLSLQDSVVHYEPDDVEGFAAALVRIAGERQRVPSAEMNGSLPADLRWPVMAERLARAVNGLLEEVASTAPRPIAANEE